MTPRKSSLYLSLVVAAALSLGFLLALYPGLVNDSRATARAGQSRLVRELELTDLALFTEARYTRHLSQADLFAPFQDHPMALEHFPSGSLVLPPERLLEGR